MVLVAARPVLSLENRELRGVEARLWRFLGQS